MEIKKILNIASILIYSVVTLTHNSYENNRKNEETQT